MTAPSTSTSQPPSGVNQGASRLTPGGPSTLTTVIAFLLGAMAMRIFSYIRRILHQPMLGMVRIAPVLEDELTLIDRAQLIATANVQAGIEPRRLPDGRFKTILVAGLRNFREPWARDFSFASFGLVELDEVAAIEDTLEVFLLNQKANGQFPVKVHSTSIFDRYVHSLFQRQQLVALPLRPKYETAHGTISLDGNALLVIAALNYLRKYDDTLFFQQHWPALKRALGWLEAQALGDDGLLHQGAYTDWADSIARTGLVHYTNVLYWKALRDFSRDAAKYGLPDDERYYQRQADRLKQAINDAFWRADFGYYVASDAFDLLSSDGNLLAVAWGLADDEQAAAILDAMERLGMADPVPTRVTSAPYGNQFVAIENRLAGIGHYHTSAAWLWLGAWHVVALSRRGRLDAAEQLLTRMADVITRDEVVHEVYGSDGRFLSTRWYTSEAPLTWSAAMFIHATAVYKRARGATKAPPTEEAS